MGGEFDLLMVMVLSIDLELEIYQFIDCHCQFQQYGLLVFVHVASCRYGGESHSRSPRDDSEHSDRFIHKKFIVGY